MRIIASLLALALGLGLSACGGGSGSSSSTTTAGRTVARPVVSLSAPTHHPSAGKPWPIVIRAHDPSGAPLRAEVRYQFLFGGSIVARRSHHRFQGTFRDTLRWPSRSAGLPLTFRAVVVTPLGTRKLDYAIRVRR